MSDLNPQPSHRLIIRRLGLNELGAKDYIRFVITCVFTYDGVTLMKSGWGQTQDQAMAALAIRMGDFLHMRVVDVIALLSPIAFSPSKAPYALTDTGDAGDLPE